MGSAVRVNELKLAAKIADQSVEHVATCWHSSGVPGEMFPTCRLVERGHNFITDATSELLLAG